jgi:hypothetical protein
MVFTGVDSPVKISPSQTDVPVADALRKDSYIMNEAHEFAVYHPFTSLQQVATFGQYLNGP